MGAQFQEGLSLKNDLEDFLHLTDNEVLASLRLAAYDFGLSGHSAARRIEERRHFKKVLEITAADRMACPEVDTENIADILGKQKGVPMPKAPPFTKQPAFVNRTQELARLREWISAAPENILFLYGPKSSGKTTLLNRFIKEHLAGNPFDLKHFNLRELLLINYESFLRVFFEPKAAEQVKETRQYDLKVFKLSVETIKGLETKTLDPFVVMKRELEKQVKKGRRPVILIDELQALDEIYFNGQRELLKEMFNFFVAMTKESHLCHIIISSSDGYFLDRIYNDSKLKKTSEFMEVNYLGREDVLQWLGDLPGYSRIDRFTLTEEQKEGIWNFFGGSCWEISSVLGDLLPLAEDGMIPDDRFKKLLAERTVAARSMFMDYVTIDPQKERLWLRVATLAQHTPGTGFTVSDLRPLVQDGTWSLAELREELHTLVRNNFLSYAPPRAEYALQGRSMEHGLSAYIRTLPDSVTAEGS